MNSQDDDGLLTPHTMQMLLRMAQNMPNPVKVSLESPLVVLNPDFNSERLRGGFLDKQANPLRVHPEASAMERQI